MVPLLVPLEDTIGWFRGFGEHIQSRLKKVEFSIHHPGWFMSAPTDCWEHLCPPIGQHLATWIIGNDSSE
jgi:hypothetical protein